MLPSEDDDYVIEGRRCAVLGWDYHPDAMTITFFGTYCSQIMGGANTDVSFVYGCPGPIIN